MKSIVWIDKSTGQWGCTCCKSGGMGGEVAAHAHICSVMTQHVPATSPGRDDTIQKLRELYPHGHEEFLPITVEELQLHSDKNHDYAGGGVPLGNFNRVAAILALYPGLNLGDRRVVALAYMLKQIDAVLWGIARKITHKVEGLNGRLQDISIYAKIIMCMGLDDTRNDEIDRQFGVDLHTKE